MEWVYSTYSQHEKSQLRLALGNCKLNIKPLSKNIDTAITPLRNFNGAGTSGKLPVFLGFIPSYHFPLWYPREGWLTQQGHTTHFLCCVNLEDPTQAWV